MIHLRRTRDAAALRGFTGVALQRLLGALLDWYYADGARGAVDFRPKARQRWARAKDRLRQESHQKCAYCETHATVVAHGDVEHFRPKSLYWWLAYCFDNYLFSCQICNQVYKRDHFDVSGPRLPQPRLPRTPPADAAGRAEASASLCPDPAQGSDARMRRRLAAEDCHLPHPYVDDPERWFAWQAVPACGEVWLVARGRSARARRAVRAATERLGLNREELLRQRWQAYEMLETMVQACQALPAGALRDDLLERVRGQAAADQPYAGMKRHFLRAWGLLPAMAPLRKAAMVTRPSSQA